MGRRPVITLPKFIYRFSTNPFKIAGFHAEIDKPTLKCHTEAQGAQNSGGNLGNEEQSGMTHTSWFKNILQSYCNPDSVALP